MNPKKMSQLHELDHQRYPSMLNVTAFSVATSLLIEQKVANVLCKNREVDNAISYAISERNNDSWSMDGCEGTARNNQGFAC